MDQRWFQAKSVWVYGRIVKGLANRILLRTRPLSRKGPLILDSDAILLGREDD